MVQVRSLKNKNKEEIKVLLDSRNRYFEVLVLPWFRFPHQDQVFVFGEKKNFAIVRKLEQSFEKGLLVVTGAGPGVNEWVREVRRKRERDSETGRERVREREKERKRAERSRGDF